MSEQAAGYSGTPLAKKLGIRAGMQVTLRDAPDGYLTWLEPLPADVGFASAYAPGMALVHLFVTERDCLRAELASLRELIDRDGAVWVSWPKKSSKMATTITEDTIRELALPLGFVDIKVCAVNAIWSGLKLVIRRELR